MICHWRSIFRGVGLLSTALALIVSNVALAEYHAASLPVSGHPITEDAIVPADVLARVGWLRDELELVRQKTGKPKDERSRFVVANAAPREVYFQAESLFHKANQLAFELTRTREEPPPSVPASQIRPMHVFYMVDAAFKRVLTVRAQLGIITPTSEQIRPPSTAPTDVFRAILAANRQINHMLEQEFSPSDVFQKTTLAVHLSARLLRQFPGAIRLPDPPDYESGKRPVDVFSRLIRCYELTSKLAAGAGLESLTLYTDDQGLGSISPSDVYDMASLVVSELAYLNDQLPAVDLAPGSYYPGPKVPSDVYQRVGILEGQLQHLLGHTQKQPGWLSPSSGETS